MVIIYSKSYCPYCIRAKALLDSKGINYQDISIDNDPYKRDEMIAKSNRHTVPQIFINDYHVGGSDDLFALDGNGQLDKLLNN
jgi:glutaredoxin 3